MLLPGRVAAKRHSVVLSVAIGSLVGATLLAVRYAPAPERGTTAPAPPAKAGSAPVEPAGAAPAPVSAVDAGPSSAPSAPSQVGRDARFDGPAAACPADMVLVEGGFCPRVAYACVRHADESRYPCAEFRRGERCLGPTDPRRYCIDRHEWPNRVGENPAVYVDWHEAKAQCASLGKRLCRRSEWILACEGPKRLPYPWGFVRQPSPCNVDRAPIPFDVEALENVDERELELARLWQADRIGSHAACVSSFGAYDMAGNVDEWTDNLADDPHTRHPATLNGGYWGPVRDTCRLTTKKHGPTFKFYQVGFRCCADTNDGVLVPPPAPFVEPEEDDEAGGSGAGAAPRDVYE